MLLFVSLPACFLVEEHTSAQTSRRKPYRPRVALTTQGFTVATNTDIKALSKDQAIELAQKMKNRALGIKKNAEALTERLVNGAIGAATGFGMGYWMGSAEAEYHQNVAKLVAEGKTPEEALKEADDPRKWMGVDKDLIVSLGLTGVALANLGGRKMSPFVEAAAWGGLAGWAYSRGMDIAIEGASEAEEEAA